MFYGVAVGANAEGNTHLSLLLHATCAPTINFFFLSNTFTSSRNRGYKTFTSRVPTSAHLHNPTTTEH